MPKIHVNLTDIKSKYDVPPGSYRARVVDIQSKESSSGNPMLVWSWEILDGDESGSEISSMTSLQPHALFSLKEHLEAFGIEGDVEFDTDTLVGKIAKITVAKETYRNRDGEEKEASRIKKVEGAKSKARSAKATPKISEDRIDDDDDMPF